jgi:nucleoside-diphosphate-sugar epimerase
MERLKVGITGGSGVLGRHILADRKLFEWFEYRGDITHLPSLKRWLSSVPKLDAVIHLAAVVAVARVDACPAYAKKVNVDGVKNLVETLAATRHREDLWFFFPSSAHVYKPSGCSLRETDLPGPFSQYGKTKLGAEKILKKLAQHFPFRYCIARIFSYTSPFQSDHFVIPALSKKIRSTQPRSCLQIRGSGNVRDFLPANIVSSHILDLASRAYTGIINIGSGHGFSIMTVAEELCRQCNREDVCLTPDNSESTVLVADVSKLKNLGIYKYVQPDKLIRYYLGCDG